MAPKKEAALAVLPDRSHDNALTGSIDELIRAFDQIGSNMAGLQLNGWKLVQHCKAACWLAHGAHMHPAVFMQNHYCMEIQGKLIVEPKWEFIVGVLQSRVPGFKFEVLEEEDDHAKVRMSDGNGNDHTVEYSVADAKRQGLFGRGGNMWTSGNTREGCLKQAIKRAGRRIGAAALMDLPMGLDGYEVPAETVQTRSTAEVIDEALGKAVEETGGGSATAESVNEPEARDLPGTADHDAESGMKGPRPVATTEPEEGPRARLYAVIAKMYGKVSKQVALEKASLLYNAMMEETTGLNPKVAFTKPGHIGPVEAEQVLAYLAKREAAKNPAGSVVAHSGVDTDVPPASSAEIVDDDEAPPPEKAASVTDEDGSAAADSYAALMQTVERARRLFPPRKFITEWPEGMGKMWYLDESTFTQAGHQAAVKIQVGPDIVAEPRVMDHLNEILTAACDARDRGR